MRWQAAVVVGLAACGPGVEAIAADPPRVGQTIGRSVEGRAIRAVRIGPASAPRKVLVVGCIHGSECAGRAVTSALRRRSPPPGTQLWVIDDANPDGSRSGRRQNARGVDLNRNFPYRWRRQGLPGSTYYSGPKPLSEPESRALAGFILRLRPGVTIWYHQALALVDRGSGADVRVVRRYARTARLPVRRIGFLPGVATRWQNHRLPGTSAFVVELPAGRLSGAAVRRHADAVRAAALASRSSAHSRHAPDSAGAVSIRSTASSSPR